MIIPGGMYMAGNARMNSMRRRLCDVADIAKTVLILG